MVASPTRREATNRFQKYQGMTLARQKNSAIPLLLQRGHCYDSVMIF